MSADLINADPIRVLVTGFGGFPGARENPTAQLMRALSKRKARLARLGFEIEPHVLPVVYAAIGPRLRELTAGFAPDVILHFGLAAGRKTLCIETRALNRLSLLHPDAAGATAARRTIIPGAAFALRATAPSGLIAAALRRAGVRAALSINAGDYLCNQTLYLSLAEAKASAIGFIHAPSLARRQRPGLRRKAAKADPRPTLDLLTRAAVIAIAAAAALRQDRLSQILEAAERAAASRHAGAGEIQGAFASATN